VRRLFPKIKKPGRCGRAFSFLRICGNYHTTRNFDSDVESRQSCSVERGRFRGTAMVERSADEADEGHAGDGKRHADSALIGPDEAARRGVTNESVSKAVTIVSGRQTAGALLCKIREN
jgi:hypothetical protein